MNEFEIIKQFFSSKNKKVILGIGDDAAIIAPKKNKHISISTDTLNEGVHFLKNTNPYFLGWKSLAVNISDITAMGSIPEYALLSLSLPRSDKKWLSKFSQGLKACAKKYNVELIGGDTTKGPLSINITIVGNANKGAMLKRSSAQIGDDIWVTDEIGYAHLGLLQSQKKSPKEKMSNCFIKKSLEKFNKPLPKNLMLNFLSKHLHAAIDISDGFIADVSHICKSSKVGAEIYIEKIPMHKWFLENNKELMALTGGEDYEIIFTAPKKNRNVIQKYIDKNKLNSRIVGLITKDKKINLYLNQKKIKLPKIKGFDHFGK
jgi:thiamine-monophosphate kinase